MSLHQSQTRQGEVVSSLRVEKIGPHWHIHIWNRGGKAGTICVDAKDGPTFTDRLAGHKPFTFSEIPGPQP